MSLALVVGLFHLLLLLINPATEGRSVAENSAAATDYAQPPAPAEEDDSGEHSELVSRRRWYSGSGEQLSQWNDHDMQWLKRDGKLTTTSGDKRGWGNGIPPWLRRRVIVGQYQIARRRSSSAEPAV